MAGCSTKYELFQEKEKYSVDNKGDVKTEGLLESIFPKKQKVVLIQKSTNSFSPEEKPLDFQYSSKIIPGDKLKIDIYNRSKKISLQEPGTKSKEEYVVDNDGMIYLPLIGVTTLKGLNEREASHLLTTKYQKYLNEPYVKVQLRSTRIYVLGEVKSPGVIPISASGISIYEVLAKSGDFTDYAKRNVIKVVSGPYGKQTIRTIDLTTMTALNRTNLMIRPNSIVYVPPKYMKSVKLSIGDVTPIVSLISSLLGTYLSIDYITNGRD